MHTYIYKVLICLYINSSAKQISAQQMNLKLCK